MEGSICVAAKEKEKKKGWATKEMSIVKNDEGLIHANRFNDV